MAKSAKTKAKVDLITYDEVVSKIFLVRGHKVMLDFDLAALFEVETKALNQAVKRNIERFPEDFMFRLTAKEWTNMRSQFVTASAQLIDKEEDEGMRSQNVTSWQGRRRADLTPFAFTEHGVTQLGNVLRSERAIKLSLAVVRTFIELKKNASQFKELAQQLELIKEHLGQHDAQLNGIYEAIENLLDDKVEKNRWEERPRIGFKP